MSLTGPLTLRFSSDDLEYEFRAEYARPAIRPARTITILVRAYSWILSFLPRMLRPGRTGTQILIHQREDGSFG